MCGHGVASARRYAAVVAYLSVTITVIIIVIIILVIIIVIIIISPLLL